MSQENLDLVRAIYEAWERGDYSATEWAHPNIEFVIADGPAPGRWEGVAGMALGWLDFLSAWDDVRPQVEEFRELDDNHVLVLVHQTGRGKASGFQVGETWAKEPTFSSFEAGR
jgi:ketosteroid isomerase-like protein